MTLAWSTPLPHADKIVLLALSDNANDEGFCYPSIATLSRKCGLEERSIHRVIVRLEEAGHVTRRERPGRSTVYTVHPRAQATPDRPSYRQKVTPTEGHPVAVSGVPDGKSGPPLTKSQTTPDRPSPITVIEPSVEPSPNRQVGKRAARAARSRIVPEGFSITEEMRAWAAEACPHVDIKAETQKFRDHEFRDPHSDWPKAWRQWMRRAPEFARPAAVIRGGLNVSAAQLDAEGLRKLTARREAIGIPNFREPASGETSAQYRQAQDAECNRLMVEKERRKATRTIADLTTAKRMST